MEITEKRISEKLRRLGVPANILGFASIKTALMLIASDESYLHKITKKLYPTIAEKYDTEASRAERAIRHAIELAYQNGDLEEIATLGVIQTRKDRMTNSEFLAALYECLKYEE